MREQQHHVTPEAWAKEVSSQQSAELRDDPLRDEIALFYEGHVTEEVPNPPSQDQKTELCARFNRKFNSYMGPLLCCGFCGEIAARDALEEIGVERLDIFKRKADDRSGPPREFSLKWATPEVDGIVFDLYKEGVGGKAALVCKRCCGVFVRKGERTKPIGWRIDLGHLSAEQRIINKLEPLSFAERFVIQRFWPYGTVIKLNQANGTVLRLRGHMISFPVLSADAVATQLFPQDRAALINERVLVQVVAQGSNKNISDWKKNILRSKFYGETFSVDTLKVYAWFAFLKKHHPQFAAVAIEEETNRAPMVQLALRKKFDAAFSEAIANNQHPAEGPEQPQPAGEGALAEGADIGQPNEDMAEEVVDAILIEPPAGEITAQLNNNVALSSAKFRKRSASENGSPFSAMLTKEPMIATASFISVVRSRSFCTFVASSNVFIKAGLAIVRFISSSFSAGHLAMLTARSRRDMVL
jgi:hypothetical protein